MSTRNRVAPLVVLSAALGAGLEEVKARLPNFLNAPSDYPVSPRLAQYQQACRTAQFVVPDILLDECAHLARFIEVRHASGPDASPVLPTAVLADATILGRLMAAVMQHLRKFAEGQWGDPHGLLQALKAARAARCAREDGSELAYALHRWSDYTLLPRTPEGPETAALAHRRLGQAGLALDAANLELTVERVRAVNRIFVAAEPRNPYAIWAPVFEAAIALTAALERYLRAGIEVPAAARHALRALRGEISRVEPLAPQQAGVPSPAAVSALFTGTLALATMGSARLGRLASRYQLESTSGSSGVLAARLSKKMGELQDQWKHAATSGTLTTQVRNLEGLVAVSKDIPSELFGQCARLLRAAVAGAPRTDDPLSSTAIGGAAALLVMKAALDYPAEFNGAAGMQHAASVAGFLDGTVAAIEFEPLVREACVSAQSKLWRHCLESVTAAQKELKSVLARIPEPGTGDGDGASAAPGERVAAFLQGRLDATLYSLDGLFEIFGARNAQAVARQLLRAVEDPRTWAHKVHQERLVNLFTSLRLFTDRLAVQPSASYGADLDPVELPRGFRAGEGPVEVDGSSRSDAPADRTALQVFIEEARELLGAALCVAGPVASAQPAPDIELPAESEAAVLQRAFHAIRGGARMVGLSIVGDVAQAYLELLDDRVREPVLDRRVAAIALAGIGAIRGWLQMVATSEGNVLTVDVSEIEAVLRAPRAFLDAGRALEQPGKEVGIFDDLLA